MFEGVCTQYQTTERNGSVCCMCTMITQLITPGDIKNTTVQTTVLIGAILLSHISIYLIRFKLYIINISQLKRSLVIIDLY